MKEEPTKNSNSSKWLWITFVLIILVGIVFFVWVYRQNIKNTVATKPTVSTTVSSAVSTANWKVYTNTKYDYSIKYPQNLTISFIDDGSAAASDIVKADNIIITNDTDRTLLIMGIKYPAKQTLEAAANNLLSLNQNNNNIASKSPAQFGVNQGYLMTLLKEVNTGSMNFLLDFPGNPPLKGPADLMAIVNNNTAIFGINMPNTVKENQDIFSTLQFTKYSE